MRRRRRPGLRRGPAHRFVPYDELDGRPSIVADGGPAPGTVLTLSHWPHTPSPQDLARDLSAEIAFAYLESRQRWPDAELVSNDHLDQDGLATVFALVDPERAWDRRAKLEQLASAGDFATFADRDAARASFALATLADPNRSPLDAASLDSWSERTPALYEELLGLLAELLDHPERHRELWAEEDESLAASEAALAAGAITIEEIPPLDLAVVRLSEAEEQRRRTHGRATRFTSAVDATVHPAAICNATRCSRLLLILGRRLELRYRYETWVRFVSRRPPSRVDLSLLAEELSAEEPAGARWTFDGVAALEPSLHLGEGEESGLDPVRYRALVERHLASAPPAWDPYGAP